MITATTVVELFEGHPERWIRGAFARNSAGSAVAARSPEAVCWCASGAILKIYGDFDEEYKKVQGLIQSDSSELRERRDVCSFNDRHSFDEVLAVLKQVGI